MRNSFQIVLLPQGEFRNFWFHQAVIKRLFTSFIRYSIFQQFNERLKRKSKTTATKIGSFRARAASSAKRFVLVKEEEPAAGFEVVLAQWTNHQAILENKSRKKRSSNGTSGKQKQLENSYHRFESLKKVMKKTILINKQKELAAQKDEIEERNDGLGIMNLRND